MFIYGSRSFIVGALSAPCIKGSSVDYLICLKTLIVAYVRRAAPASPTPIEAKTVILMTLEAYGSASCLILKFLELIAAADYL